jgi:hypothetical protein
MSLFYVGREHDARLCCTSLKTNKPITVTGIDGRGQWSVYSGNVWAVESDNSRPRHRRWRVRMEESATPATGPIASPYSAVRMVGSHVFLAFALGVGAVIILGG